ncbi:MAG: tetratricopeptide repeat protein [Acidimicrobiia bacterium]|nr:tetratricopeptide repeat protein [Acidimicrobiia bacterium]
MRRTIAAGSVLLIGALAASPVQAADREHQQMMADIRMLQEQAQQLAIAVATLSDALRLINTRLDQQVDADRKTFADQKVLFDSIGDDLRIIRERSSETNVRISALDQEVEALRASIPIYPPPMPMPLDPADPSAAGDPAAAAGTPPAAPVMPIPQVPATPSPAGLSPRRMLDQAFADYTSGQYVLAIQGYEAFLRTFPGTDLADDAQFMIGEAHYAAGRNPNAVNAYNEVIRLYPGSNAAPDAYYKRGLAMERQGNVDAARESWELAVKGFPESDAGRLAQQGLDRLAARQP